MRTQGRAPICVWLAMAILGENHTPAEAPVRTSRGRGLFVNYQAAPKRNLIEVGHDLPIVASPHVISVEEEF